MKDTVMIYNPKDLVSVLKFNDCPECGRECQSIIPIEHTDTGYKVQIQCNGCKKIFWKMVDRMDVPDKVKVTWKDGGKTNVNE